MESKGKSSFIKKIYQPLNKQKTRVRKGYKINLKFKLRLAFRYPPVVYQTFSNKSP